ncbi:MAG: oligosaccharide flippase family protein [bacterium]|nr:oligosaccharide flippase family protein [bacterium]
MSLKRGALYLMAGWFAILVTGYGLNLVLARWFPLGSFGDYGTVMTVLLWIEILVITGLPFAVQKYASAHGGESRSILQAALRIQAAVTAGLTALLVLAAPLFAGFFRDPHLTPYFRLAFLNLPFYGFFHLVVAYHNGRRAFGRQGACYVFYGLAKLGSVLLLCRLRPALDSAFTGNILGSALSLAFAWALMDDRKSRPPRYGRELVRFALPALLYSLMTQLLMSVDLWSVRALLGDAASGHYYVAATLSRIPYYGLAGLSAVLMPVVSEALASGAVERAGRTMANAIRFAAFMLIPLCLMITVFRGEIVLLLFPEAYLPAAPLLGILAWAMTAMAVLNMLLTLISADGRPRQSSRIAAASVAADLVLIAVLAPRFGARGAAWASLVSIGLACVWGAADVLAKYAALPGGASIGRIGMATAGLLACLVLPPVRGPWFMAAAAAGTAVFAGILLATGELRRDDLKVFTRSPGPAPSPPPESA